MKKTDLAYIAGIVDGEGCIHLKKRHDGRNKGNTYQLVVSVTNTNEWLCSWLQFCYGGRLVRRQRDNPRHKDAWEWTLSCLSAKSFLLEVAPYLRIKRPQAEIAIHLGDNMHRRKLRGGGTLRIKTPDERLIDDDLFAKLRTLNAKGKPIILELNK